MAMQQIDRQECCDSIEVHKTTKLASPCNRIYWTLPVILESGLALCAQEEGIVRMPATVN